MRGKKHDTHLVRGFFFRSQGGVFGTNTLFDGSIHFGPPFIGGQFGLILDLSLRMNGSDQLELPQISHMYFTSRKLSSTYIFRFRQERHRGFITLAQRILVRQKLLLVLLDETSVWLGTRLCLSIVSYSKRNQEFFFFPFDVVSR
jgi:hypothetical protein